jgi:O-antigen/teichoic acid export membrane protein
MSRHRLRAGDPSDPLVRNDVAAVVHRATSSTVALAEEVPTPTATGRRRTPTVAANMFTAAVGNAITPLAALISLPILTYTLGVTGRGEIAAATAPLLLAVTAGTFGIPEAVAFLVARTPRLLGSAVRRGAALITVAGVLATLTCFAASELLADGDQELQEMIIIACLAVTPTVVVLILRAGAAGLQWWRLVAAEQAITAVLRLIGIAVLAVVGQLTPLAAVVIIAITPVLGGLAYLPLRGRARPPVPDPAEPAPPPVSTGAILGYGGRIWFGSLTGVLLARLDQTIMTPLAGTYQLGLYAVAVNISDAALVLHSAIRDVTFTADAAHRDDEKLCASARISGFVSLMVGLVLAAVMPFALPLVFGADFAPALPAVLWLLGAVAVVAPGSIAGAGLSARGRPGLRSLALAIACVINIAVLLALVPALGAVGAAIATFAGNIVASQINIFALSRLGHIRARRFYGLRRSDLVIIATKLHSGLAAVADKLDRSSGQGTSGPPSSRRSNSGGTQP